MNYSPEAFAALMQEVESQGGALLPDPCLPQDIVYTIPPYKKNPTLRKVTCGCGHEARTVSIYDPKTKVRQGGSGFVTACAVCDAVGAWPRYCKAVYDADPDLDPMRDDEDDDDGN